VKIIFQTMIVLLAVALAIPALADSIYTWTDKSGVLHFTDTPPPNQAKVLNRLDYQPEPQQKGTSSDQIDEKEQQREEKQTAAQEAERKRRAADEAMQAAQQAVKQAETAKAEAEAYYDKVGAKSRRVKSLRYKLKAYDDRAVEAAKHADELLQQATQAEADAQAAEERLKTFDQSPPQ
jgi:chromosome segregation ATPase